MNRSCETAIVGSRADQPRTSPEEASSAPRSMQRVERETLGAEHGDDRWAAGSEPVSLNRDSMISVGVVRGLVEFVERVGVSSAQLLCAAGLPPDRLDGDDTRLPRAEVYRLIDQAIELSGDPALGLHWGETIGEGTFAPISPLIAHASTLRQALDSLAQFHGLLSEQASYELVEHGECLTVRSRPLPGESARLQRFVVEMTVLGFRRLVRFFDLRARHERVSLAYAAPSYRTEYERLFDPHLSFGQPFSGITFQREVMDAPAPHKDVDVHKALLAVAERRLLRITQRTPYALRVREALVREASPHRADMENVARTLGLSARSLRRRLANEDKSYGEVANEARAIIAKHLLRDRQKTIQETAYEMGFSDTSTFHRAFKSWTGMTPRAYRETHCDGQD
jgi:AraC-like DNA-binding protein